MLKINHGEAEGTAETKTPDRSCRNFKRDSWVLFHSSNEVSLSKLKLSHRKLFSFLHFGFASSEIQLCNVHLECTPMYTYLTYSFWIYHAVCLQPHCRPLWKDHHGSNGEGWDMGFMCPFSPHLALLLGAWAALKPLMEPKPLLLLRQKCEWEQVSFSIAMKGRIAEPSVKSRAQGWHLYRESFISQIRSVWWREWSCCSWTQRRSQILRQRSPCQMLSACTARICPPWDHLQSLGGRLGDRWEVRRNNGFAAMWNNQPFFISHRVESRRRLLSPE